MGCCETGARCFCAVKNSPRHCSHLQNGDQIAAAEHALANASAALTYAQAQVIVSQPPGSAQDPLLQQAECVLAMVGNVATRILDKRKA